jgi:biotin synthase
VNRSDILGWLLEEDRDRLEMLWTLADDARRKHVGDAIPIRGLIEFSNHCRRHCHYCGIRSDRKSLARYRMTGEEIIASAREAVARGYGTVVMQSGEDPGLDVDWLAGIIRTIKRETPLAVTLSCGERSVDELARLYDAGADRYYLRFETSDRLLWSRIHPSPGKNSHHRLDILAQIKEIGYETGSGVMVGIPGQTWFSIVEDIEWFQKLDLDMIGCGPYVPHQDTPSGRICLQQNLSGTQRYQVPATNLATYKIIALTRLLCPEINIPATTALATLNKENGYRMSLMRGANVLMVNLTPLKYRRFYEIYPAKAGIDESDSLQQERVEALVSGLGRFADTGPGISLNHQARASFAVR